MPFSPADDSQSINLVKMSTKSPLHMEEGKAMESLMCAACDPNSLVPHDLQVSRIRIANLCCTGEERIIHSTLSVVHGIDSVNVNVVGRYAIVKHCYMECCAPVDTILTLLNDQRLGASLQETKGNNDRDEEEEAAKAKLTKQGAHAAIVLFLFFVAIIIDLFTPLHNSKIYPLVAYLGCCLIGVIPILTAAIDACMRQQIDIHILMLVAITGAMASQEFLDASLVITLFIAANFVESVVMYRVRKAVNITLGKVSTTAVLASGETVKVDDLKIGDVIAARTGDMVMADGVVTKGQAVLDESALTGEALPIGKSKGDRVLSSGVVQNGYIEVRVDTSPEESTIRKVNQSVADVQADRSEFAKIVDKFASWWTPCVLFSAVMLVLIAGGATTDWHKWLHRSLVLLVLACPCAIVIAAPIPSVCAIATSARHGVLIKGSSIVENLSAVNILAVDKTGTLTKGFFSVSAIENVREDDGSDSEAEYDVMELAAALESKSTHPLANAIVSIHCGCIAEFEGKLPEVKKVDVMEGVGLQGWVEVDDDWKHVAIGNERLLKSNKGKVHISKAQQAKALAFERKHSGSVILYIAVDDELERMLALSDELRSDAFVMANRMQKLGFPVAMLTGDHDTVARSVCDVLGIDECHSRLLPHEKTRWITNKQSSTPLESSHDSAALQLGSSSESTGPRKKKSLSKVKGGVVMLGDGINDAAALAAARVGVAMGAGGSAMTIAAADVVIMSENLLRLPSTIGICKHATRVIWQNCFFAIFIKLGAIILAIMGMLDLWQAVLIDVGSLIVVVANGSMLLFDKSFEVSDVPNEPDRKEHIKEVLYNSPRLQEDEGMYKSIHNDSDEDS